MFPSHPIPSHSEQKQSIENRKDNQAKNGRTIVDDNDVIISYFCWAHIPSANHKIRRTKAVETTTDFSQSHTVFRNTRSHTRSHTHSHTLAPIKNITKNKLWTIMVWMMMACEVSRWTDKAERMMASSSIFIACFCKYSHPVDFSAIQT